MNTNMLNSTVEEQLCQCCGGPVADGSIHTGTERVLMLPMAEIPWFERYPFDGESFAPTAPPPWTTPWCCEQQRRALEQGHAFYEGRYDYDGNAAPSLVIGTAPTCPGCGRELPCSEVIHSFARTAFAAAQHAPTHPYKLTFEWYSPTCACGVSSWWELRWQNYGSYWDLRWRHQRGQAGAPSPDAALTIAVDVRSAERHHNPTHRTADTDLPFLDDDFPF
jgi:hypothetical protein